jgi:hypothetical protein
MSLTSALLSPSPRTPFPALPQPLPLSAPRRATAVLPLLMVLEATVPHLTCAAGSLLQDRQREDGVDLEDEAGSEDREDRWVDGGTTRHGRRRRVRLDEAEGEDSVVEEDEEDLADPLRADDRRRRIRVGVGDGRRTASRTEIGCVPAFSFALSHPALNNSFLHRSLPPVVATPAPGLPTAMATDRIAVARPPTPAHRPLRHGTIDLTTTKSCGIEGAQKKETKP